MEVGKTVRGKPEKGPPCDHKRAHCAGEERGMEWRKKLADASNCQPRAGSLQMSTFFDTGQRGHHQSSDVRMSLRDHPEAVRPTGATCGCLP